MTEETGILYGEHRRRAEDRFAVGGTPWHSSDYLDHFEQLPERRLYLENRDPEEIKVILSGPLQERRVGYRSDEDKLQFQYLTTVTPFGFSIYVRSRLWKDGRQEVRFHRERGYWDDLGENLEYFAELHEQSRENYRDLRLLEAGMEAPTEQQFHDQFVNVLSGRAGDQPLIAFPIIRGTAPDPEQWKRCLSGGSMVHKRLTDDAWLRISISGWSDDSSEPGVDLQGVTGDVGKAEAEKLWAEAIADGKRRRLADTEMPELFEYPGLRPANLDHDPRAAALICGAEQERQGYPIYG